MVRYSPNHLIEQFGGQTDVEITYDFAYGDENHKEG